MTDDAALAAELVRDAGRLAQQMRRRGVAIDRKTSVSDIVTDADHAAEKLIVERLHAERPDDGIVGEEGTREAGARTWLLDPIDGTYNYASGIPFWCSAVALVDADGPVLGAVHIPESDELWVGGRGLPTTCNGIPTELLRDRSLDEVSVCSYLHPETIPSREMREPLLRMIRPAATVRMFGSGSVELAWIAGGRIGAFAQYDCQDWDWYPGQALVLGAGGAARVVEHGGHHWHLAGNRRTVDDLAAALNA